MKGPRGIYLFLPSASKTRVMEGKDDGSEGSSGFQNPPYSVTPARKPLNCAQPENRRLPVSRPNALGADDRHPHAMLESFPEADFVGMRRRCFGLCLRVILGMRSDADE